MTKRYDLIVVGGGPSGSTMAHLVAAAGARVLVIERETFPRFHVGESLLPANFEIFDRLGYRPAAERHVKKLGAEFFDSTTGDRATYLFAESMGAGADHAYQVERSGFDLELIEAASRAGVEVHQGERVTEVGLVLELSEPASDPTVETDKGSYSARYVVDATGLDSLFAYKNKTRRRLDAFGLGAVFRHYGDLRPDIAAELTASGNIKVAFLREGWLWAIPLIAGRVSVGLVTRRKGLKAALLDAAIAESGEMARLLEMATPEGSARTLASFSFLNTRPFGPRWSCVGDAACFLDPVFSSGVALGMLGASRAADVLLEALEIGDEGEGGLMRPHEERMRKGYDIFATLINAIYMRRLLPDLFFAREQSAELRRGMTSILAGDVWRDDNVFLDMLWRSRLRYELDFEPTPRV